MHYHCDHYGDVIPKNTVGLILIADHITMVTIFTAGNMFTLYHNVESL